MALDQFHYTNEADPALAAQEPLARVLEHGLVALRKGSLEHDAGDRLLPEKAIAAGSQFS